MLPMLLVDVVKFAVGSWSGRSADEFFVLLNIGCCMCLFYSGVHTQL